MPSSSVVSGTAVMLSCVVRQLEDARVPGIGDVRDGADVGLEQASRRACRASRRRREPRRPQLCSTPVLADAHSDLLMELVHFRGEQRPFAKRWLRPLEAGGVQLQVCALFSADGDLPEMALRKALLGVGELDRAVAENPPLVAVRSAADLDAALMPGRLGLMLSIEGMEPLGHEPALIDVFCRLGVRMASLTWNRRNAVRRRHGGGSPRGSQQHRPRARGPDGRAPDRLRSLARQRGHLRRGAGAHRRPPGARQPRALPRAPGHPAQPQRRAAAALAERDGVVGLMALPFVVHPSEWTIPRLIDHVDHLAETIGVRHICLGGDFARQIEHSGASGAAALTSDMAIEGLSGPEEYPALFAALSERGYGDDDLRAIASENLLRVLRRTLPA